MLVGFAVLAASVPAAAPTAAQDRHDPIRAPQETARLPEGMSSVVVPLRTSGEHILLPVAVAGSAPIWVVLDTGMPGPGVLLYDGPRVDALKLAYGPMRAQVGGAGGAGRTFEARIAPDVTLRIGDAEISGAIATVLPRVPFLSATHNGIIGNAVFRNFVVTIDRDRGVIELTRPEAFAPPPGAGEVAIELVRNTPYVEAGWVGSDGRVVPLELVLDLGATHPVSLNATSNPAIVVPEDALRTRVGRGMSGPVAGRVGRIAGLVLGGHRLENLIATFPDPAHENPRGLDSRNGNLGVGALGRFNLSIDYHAKKLYLAPNHRFAEPFDWDMSGLVLEPGSDDRLVVAEVAPGSPAAEAGIAAGDAVIAIDGEAIAGRDYPRVRERLKTVGAEVTLECRRGSQARTAKLRLRRRI
jgi:hypothetical protein